VNGFRESSRAAWGNLVQCCGDLLFPLRCVICGDLLEPDGDDTQPALLSKDFCPGCREGLLPIPEAHCRRCGIPFKTALPTVHTCAQCLRRIPAFDQALAAGRFSDNLRKAIHVFKYSGRGELARPLARFMALELDPPFFPPQTELILPVPLHWRRLRERGFNQALILARELFAANKDRISFDLLIRTRWTEPQINFSGPERYRNVRHAFAVTDPGKVKGKSVMLVDDVFTTGATVSECAQVLKKAGADTVLVVTLARVVTE
jgi:ComF family protein